MEQSFTDTQLQVSLEFSGGLDSLVLNQERQLTLTVHGSGVTLGQLIAYVRRSVIGAKKDFFSFSPELISDNSADTQEVRVECNVELFNGVINRNEFCKIRPGVLVLVNDVDWELLGRERAVLDHNQNITFISTLHGG